MENTLKSSRSDRTVNIRRIATLSCIAITLSCPVQAADLRIELTNLGDQSGKVMLNVVRNEAQMKNAEPAEAAMMLNPGKDGVSLTLHNLPAGIYGIQVFHDENGNGELDANLLGIPKEP